MGNLPSGTVTFLFTDIEGSTKLAQSNRGKWEYLQLRHHEILKSAIESNNGYVFQIIGDAFCASFHTAGEAIRAAAQAQIKFYNEDWGATPVKVRMGINTGTAEASNDTDHSDGYKGYTAMARVQRIMSAGHGGQILISASSQELVHDELPEGTSLRDLGEKRLKDFIYPEHIYQLMIPNLPIDFPPIKTLDSYNHNLPSQLTSFIGRKKEIAEIKKAISKHRLVTLTGSGGIGKSRLALQVGTDLLDSFPDGIWLVELAPLSDPSLISQTILATLGQVKQRGMSIFQSIQEFLEEKKVLLILDNCEHLIEQCATIADELLGHTKALKIVATSREVLGVAGELTWHVPSLSTPDIKNLPEFSQITQFEAIQLFVERVSLINSHFEVTKENTSAIAQICFRLGGIPLAIELAAARLKSLSVEQVNTRLDDRFRLLTGGVRTVLPRQQTLQATIDWSYNLLSEKEKILFRRLAIFIGGWTLESAEDVCSDDLIDTHEVLDLMSNLVNKSLIITEEVAGEVRYRRLETIRQYAYKIFIESEEINRIRDQHLNYFSKFSKQYNLGLDQSLDVNLAINIMQLEHDNLRTALQWSLVSRPDAILDLAAPLSEFWLFNNYWEEGIKWLEKCVKATIGILSASRIRIMFNLIICFVQIGEGDKADIMGSNALTEARTLADSSSLADVLVLQAWVEMERGNLNIASEIVEEVLPLARETYNNYTLSMALVIKGLIMAIKSDFEQAEVYLHKSLDISVPVRPFNIRTLAYWFLSSFALANSEIPVARNHINFALSENKGARNPSTTAHIMEALGRVQIAEGDLNAARQSIRKSTTALRKHAQAPCLAHALESFARLAMAENNPTRATQVLATAEAYLESLNMALIPAEKVLYDQTVSAARNALTNNEFISAWKQGRATDIEHALKKALETTNE